MAAESALAIGMPLHNSISWRKGPAARGFLLQFVQNHCFFLK
jgi:hypothetical protein